MLKLKPKKSGTFAPKITLKGIKKHSLDDNIPTEEHFILRVAHAPTATALREYVKKRELPATFHIQFSEDPRHAIFKLNDTTLDAVLVDLPCIIESQKTLDNKQFYKIADISQVIIHFY